ncbi:MAG: cupin domain-containing protein [Pseudomonadota bacterium]|nr:cupin domain-containing protein [Pseudomonadota bacterium]
MTIERLQGVSLADGHALQRYWQSTPVILERAVDVSVLVPDAETLVQILTETDLPSRLLTGVEGSPFTLEYGPFESFSSPKKPWTALMHALEHLFPEYEEIRQSMTWLPHWRFEDCMLSWASVDGSVGRHFDQFSVFLIQLNGRRHWEIGPWATNKTLMVPNQPIALVEPQEPMTTWIANPGDVLYLPPNIIHHGVSLDPDCITLSLGFRAPDVGALLEGALETLDTQQQHIRFDDAGRSMNGAPAEILASDLDKAKEAIIRYLDEPRVLEHLLATRVTAPYLEIDPRQEIEEQDIDPLITSVTQWELDPGCRMAYVNQTLYVNGERIGDQTPSDLLHLANTRAIQSSDIWKLEGLWRDTIIELIRSKSLVPSANDRP